jgi:inhibitor of cysteine peptidase
MTLRVATARAFVLALALGACDQGPSAAPEPQIKVIRGRATVESIEVVIDPSAPSQAQVVARGYLADGCTRIDRVEVHSPRGNLLVSATITTVRLAELTCIQVTKPFEERIAVDLADLPEGSYVVEVNGVAQSFRVRSGND